MYGPVRTVVWQGSAGDRRPYADPVAHYLPIAANIGCGDLTGKANLSMRNVPIVAEMQRQLHWWEA